MDTLEFSRSIPVRHDVDVFVAGGGPAGMAAAVTAARQGCRVFLVEGQGCFGGMGTAALVPAFMQFSDGVHFLAAGFGEEVYSRLKARRALADDRPDLSVSINVEDLKRVYDQMAEEAGFGFSLLTQLIGVEAQNGRIEHVVCAGKSGLFAVKARVYIDATGDGDLAAWAGAEFEKGDAQGRMMPGTLCSLWANIDWERANALPQHQKFRLEDAFRDKVFTQEDWHLPGIWHVGPGMGGGNIGHMFGVDATDERSLTESLLLGRKIVEEYEIYYRQYVQNGFEEMHLVGTGMLPGIRESRRILGDVVLELRHFEERANFDDEIGRYSYNVDVHAATSSKDDFAAFEKDHTTLRYKPGENYGIPYGVLLPRGLENGLVAGRCVSTDRYMQSSLRVMPGCYITGQAAGMAAALACELGCGPREVPVSALQRRLVKMGAYLPNFAA